MKRPPSSGKLLLAILRKDIRVYGRNLVYLFLTLLSLVFFIAIFWLVPDQVEEDLTFAITPPLSVLIGTGQEELRARGAPAEVISTLDQTRLAFEDEGLILFEFETEEQLKKVLQGELDVYKRETGQVIIHDPKSDQDRPADAGEITIDLGIAFPATFLSDAILEESPEVTFYAPADVPDELKKAMEGYIREMAYQLAGYELPITMPQEDEVILGTDRMGDQISTREKLRPMLAFFIMMMETFALASLISNEVLQRTVTALLITPARTSHFLLAKTIFGTALAMGQATIILFLVGAFSLENWSLLLLTIFLGSLLFTAVAMFVGAAGKDFIGQLMFSMLFIIPLMIPAFAVLFPGSTAAWVSYLPSYPVVRLLYDITIYALPWSEALSLLLYALLWVVIIYGMALVVLKRKVASL